MVFRLIINCVFHSKRKVLKQYTAYYTFTCGGAGLPSHVVGRAYLQCVDLLQFSKESSKPLHLALEDLTVLHRAMVEVLISSLLLIISSLQENSNQSNSRLRWRRERRGSPHTC